MNGVCKFNRGADLGPPERGFLYFPQTVFNLVIGSAYKILGMGIFESMLVVLALDDTGKPNWLPIGLFSIESISIPDAWEFTLLDGPAASGGATGDHWVAMWGYPELVRNRAHSDELVERDPIALAIFFNALES
jgi:hypothetical protein